MTERGRPFCTAFWMIAEVAKMCSIVPLMLVKKPSWRLVSIISLSRRKRSSRRARILLKSLPIAEVSAIGQKFSGQVLIFGD